MKNRILLLACLLFIIAGDLCAQWHPSALMDVNNIKTILYGNGNFYRNRGPFSNGNLQDYGYIVPPKGMNVDNLNEDKLNTYYYYVYDGRYTPKYPTTIYQNTLWLAGMDGDNKLHCAAVRYNQVGEDFWSGPLRTTDATTDIYGVMDYHHVWKIKRSDIDAIINNTCTEIPEDILTWPAHGNTEDGYAQNLAPFVDTDGDGIYNPQKGDYPDILGDMALYCIYNDNFDVHTESAGEALGVEIHCMLYGFNAPDDEKLHNTLFMRNWIYNRSSNNYNDMYAGYWTDFDIGFSRDDYVGCDVERNYYYGYNGVNVDGQGEPYAYGENPPAQMVMILGGPTADNNQRLGMSKFLYHDNNAGDNGDPSKAEEYYNYMRGIWKNGERMHYGGNGVPGSSGVTDLPCDYMFPHDSDPDNIGTGGITPDFNGYWSEETCNDGTPNIPYDRRGLASSGPFSLESGSVQIIDRAYVTYWPSNGFDRDEMDTWADYIRNYFINNLNK